MEAYAIANLESSPDRSFFDRIGRLVDAGVDFVQIRAKTLADVTAFSAAEKCRSIVVPPARLIVNGRADIALAVGADGVHLPAAGIPVAAVLRIAPSLIVGRSCHSAGDCATAAAEGASYALLGPLFPPRSKEGAAAVTTEEFTEAGASGIPIYALGGISRERLASVAKLPAAGVAAITLFMSDEPLDEIVEAVHRL